VPAPMDAELRGLLERFLAGTLSVADLADEVESFDIWNGRQDGDPEIVVLRGPVGRLELCTTEILEGLRPEAELRELVRELLHPEAGTTVERLDRVGPGAAGRA